MFLNHTQMWNFGKYMSSVLTATLSFLNGFDPRFFWYLVTSSIFSTCYAYYWDLVLPRLYLEA